MTAKPAAADDSAAAVIRDPPAFIRGGFKPLPPGEYEQKMAELRARERAQHLRDAHGPVLNGIHLRSGLPARLVESRLDELTRTDWNAGALRLAADFVAMPDSAPLTLFLHGDIGTGKTAIAARILAEVIAAGGAGRFVRLTTLLNMAGGYEERRRVTEEYGRTPLLVLDDMGAEKPSEFTIAVLSALLDERYFANRRTVISSNYTLAELAQRLSTAGEEVAARRIVDRLFEMTGGEEGMGRIELRGKSMRSGI
jgi:DNA replication protein DnaC